MREVKKTKFWSRVRAAGQKKLGKDWGMDGGTDMLWPGKHLDKDKSQKKAQHKPERNAAGKMLCGKMS